MLKSILCASTAIALLMSAHPASASSACHGKPGEGKAAYLQMDLEAERAEGLPSYSLVAIDQIESNYCNNVVNNQGPDYYFMTYQEAAMKVLELLAQGRMPDFCRMQRNAHFHPSETGESLIIMIDPRNCGHWAAHYLKWLIVTRQHGNLIEAVGDYHMFAKKPGRYQYQAQWQGAYNGLLREAHLPPSAPQNIDLRDDDGKPVSPAVRTQMAVIEAASEFSPDRTEEITHAIKTETVDQWTNNVLNGKNFQGLRQTMKEFGLGFNPSSPAFREQLRLTFENQKANGKRQWNGADDDCDHWKVSRPLWCGLRDHADEIKARASQQTQDILASSNAAALTGIRKSYEKSGMTPEQIDRQMAIVKQTIH